MEYFVVLFNNKAAKVTGTLLEALTFIGEKKAVIHRIHMAENNKLVVQEIAIKSNRASEAVIHQQHLDPQH
jgi:hypothetical protein